MIICAPPSAPPCFPLCWLPASPDVYHMLLLISTPSRVGKPRPSSLLCSVSFFIFCRQERLQVLYSSSSVFLCSNSDYYFLDFFLSNIGTLQYGSVKSSIRTVIKNKEPVKEAKVCQRSYCDRRAKISDEEEVEKLATDLDQSEHCAKRTPHVRLGWTKLPFLFSSTSNHFHWFCVWTTLHKILLKKLE